MYRLDMGLEATLGGVRGLALVARVADALVVALLVPPHVVRVGRRVEADVAAQLLLLGARGLFVGAAQHLV